MTRSNPTPTAGGPLSCGRTGPHAPNQSPRTPLSVSGKRTYSDQHSTDKPLIPTLLTREEAANHLRVSMRTLDKLRAAGELRGTNILGRVIFRADELQRFIDRQTEGGGR